MIHHHFDFTDKCQWSWPENDYKLLQVIDQVSDIDYIMRFVKNRNLVVQAGGACGIWPYRFSQIFKTVYTFEPDNTNYKCLLENTIQCNNVLQVNAALSDTECRGNMMLHDTEHGNVGALYFKKDNQNIGNILALRLDSLELPECDLIQLDIEGHEAAAIRGAENTIMEYKPVIVIEEKKLPQSDDDIDEARYLLGSMGYRQAGTVHRDVIFTC